MKKTLTLLKRVVDNVSNFRTFNNFLHQIIIGQILSDGNLVRRSPTANRYFRVSCGTPFGAYAHWLRQFFQEYMNKGVVKRKDRGYDRYDIVTGVNRRFNYYYKLFYVYNRELDKYVKMVPAGIVNMMTPVVLAHFIMGDGSWIRASSTVKLATHSFTYPECLILAERITKMGIKTTVNKDQIGSQGNQQYYLRVSSKDIEKLRKLVVPYMFEGMLYKVGIGEKQK